MEVKPSDGSGDISTLQQKSSSRSAEKGKLTKKQKLIVLVIVIVVALAGILYLIGNSIYNKGYNAGMQQGKKEATSAGLLSNISNPFQSVSGRVVEVKDDKITVVTTKGDNKTVKIDKSTKITKKTTILTQSDLKKDQKVTIFTQGKDKDITATRIVLRD